MIEVSDIAPRSLVGEQLRIRRHVQDSKSCSDCRNNKYPKQESGIKRMKTIFNYVCLQYEEDSRISHGDFITLNPLFLKATSELS
jgi:hypothetical protein